MMSCSWRSTTQRERKFLFFLFFIALLVCGTFFGLLFNKKEYADAVNVDSRQYDFVAVSLVQGKGYSDYQGNPYFYRLPGYPFFLAFCYKIFGYHQHAAILMQIILSSFIPLMVFSLALILFPHHYLAG
jgi:hypothetical protein